MAKTQTKATTLGRSRSAPPPPSRPPQQRGGKIVPVGEKVKTVRSLLLRAKEQIEMALPRHLTTDRMVRTVMTAVQSNPKLLDCSQQSLIRAVMEAAQLGLMPDGILGHGYLIPYGQKAQFIPGYKGFIDLARRSGHVQSMAAHVVYEADEFSYTYGLDETLVHKPSRDKQRGRRVAVYAVARFKDGGHAFEVLEQHDIDFIKSHSAAVRANKKDSPWFTHEDEMWRKSAIRRLAKYLPMSVELQAAVALDEQREEGITLDVESSVVAEAAAAEEDNSKGGLDTLADALTEDLPDDGDEAGVATGLAWTETGG